MPMRIALLTTWFPPVIVGSGNRFYELGKRLAAKHEIHVYTTGIPGTVREEEMDGMQVHRYGIFDPSKKSIEKESTVLSLILSGRLLTEKSSELIRGFKSFDLVDCNIVSKVLPYVASLISKSMHIPLIETWHEVWYEQNFTQYSPFRALPGFVLESLMPWFSDINIAVSETTKRRLIELLRVNPHKIVVISNGVDLKKFEAKGEKTYGRILYVGRLERHKRVDRLLLAYERLKRVHPEIELIIIGKGPQKEYLQHFSEKLKLENVTFLDPLPYERLLEVMKSSWIVVQPSIREGQGIVLLEAMAAGTPPIAVQAKGSAVGDVIKNNDNGLLVPEGGMERAIHRLLTDDDLYQQLRKQGLTFVRAYDWAILANKVDEIYEKLEETR
ncbi:MAG: glycosyltransferase family 1 protein [Methanophagales archaeon ANME-1-THS]|nr:MAG: glycosyltransferase family 1 protein [Methanophagales archaeon ANME-1-THS]